MAQYAPRGFTRNINCLVSIYLYIFLLATKYAPLVKQLPFVTLGTTIQQILKMCTAYKFNWLEFVTGKNS